jgi:hypothetical protein
VDRDVLAPAPTIDNAGITTSCGKVDLYNGGNCTQNGALVATAYGYVANTPSDCYSGPSCTQGSSEYIVGTNGTFTGNPPGTGTYLKLSVYNLNMSTWTAKLYQVNYFKSQVVNCTSNYLLAGYCDANGYSVVGGCPAQTVHIGSSWDYQISYRSGRVFQFACYKDGNLISGTSGSNSNSTTNTKNASSKLESSYLTIIAGLFAVVFLMS